MTIVTCFDSSAPPEEDLLRSECMKLVGSLDRVSLEIAENRFTALAKRGLKKRLPKSHYLLAKEARERRPFWVAEYSLVLDVEEGTSKEVAEKQAAHLANMIDNLGDAIDKTIWPASVDLIDSLSARITQVGPRSLRFILKQKWTTAA